MNRNVIIAAVVALFVGLWSGMILSRSALGVDAPPLAFAAAGEEGPRGPNAPRAGVRRGEGMAFLRLRLDTDGVNPKACLEFSSLSPATRTSPIISGLNLKRRLTLKPPTPWRALRACLTRPTVRSQSWPVSPPRTAL